MDLLTALLVLDIMHRAGKSLAELIEDLKVFPQVIVNVKVRERRPLETMPTVVAATRAAEDELADSGRVVIRYSGTEALARVMIEAESETGDADARGGDRRGDPGGDRSLGAVHRIGQRVDQRRTGRWAWLLESYRRARRV